MMNKLLLIFSFLISLVCFVSQSWALPNCPSSPPFDNCYGSYTFNNGGIYLGEWQNNKYNGQGGNAQLCEARQISEIKNDNVSNNLFIINLIKDHFICKVSISY